jgi:hypothetical protein
VKLLISSCILDTYALENNMWANAEMKLGAVFVSACSVARTERVVLHIITLAVG